MLLKNSLKYNLTDEIKTIKKQNKNSKLKKTKPPEKRFRNFSFKLNQSLI